VLLVEDDENLGKIVARDLAGRGHVATVATTGTQALEAARLGHFDAAILDWVLPDRDGLSVLRAWREAGMAMPVIMLTGRSEVDDKVTGLRAGADDYLVKPFEFEELLARLEAVLRRGGRDGPIEVGHAVVDPHRRTITVGEASEKLTDREAALLLELLRHAGEPLSRSHLIEAVWRGEPVNPNVVDVYVGYLRAKLESLPAAGFSIASVRRVGFKLDVAA
jgi:two-component system OmpR family response regulator